LAELPEAIRRGVASAPQNGRFYLDTPDAITRRTVIKLAWETPAKAWVATLHNRIPKDSAGQGWTTDVPVATGSPTVPEPNPHGRNSCCHVEVQDAASLQRDPTDPAANAMQAEIAAARADLDDMLADMTRTARL